MNDTREIKIITIRGEDLKEGDIFRQTQKPKAKREQFRPAVSIQPNGKNFQVYYEAKEKHATSYVLINRYELLEIQVYVASTPIGRSAKASKGTDS